MHIPRTHLSRRACSIYVHCRRGDWRRGGRRETRPKKRSPTNTPLVFFAPPCSTDYSTILRALAGQRLERFAARPRGSMGEGVTSLSRSPHRLWPDTRRGCALAHAHTILKTCYAYNQNTNGSICYPAFPETPLPARRPHAHTRAAFSHTRRRLSPCASMSVFRLLSSCPSPHAHTALWHCSAA